MNGCCKEVIEPSIKLGRLISFLKFIVFIHFMIIFIELFLIETGFFFLLFIQILVLLVGISSKHFAQFLLLILVCFFNFILIFQTLGSWFQVGFYKNDNSFVFCFFVFIAVFELFCIFISFQAYKQSKQEYRIKFGYAEGENIGGGNNIENAQDFEDNVQGFNNVGNNVNNINNGNNNNNNGGGGFVPFQGRGYAVGGN